MKVGFFLTGGAFALTCFTCTETQKAGLTTSGDVGCVDGVYSGELNTNMTAEGEWCEVTIVVDYMEGNTKATRGVGQGEQPDHPSLVTEIRK